MEKNDNVNHPKHYEGSCSIECIDMMEAFMGRKAVYSFCLGNAFKYIWRHKYKNGFEDLEKAGWYLNHAKGMRDQEFFEENDLIELLEKAKKVYQEEEKDE